jgi:phosphate starvation-inducible PhoH-like protein|tara:strand:+ start:504 stop:1196 length:693 start_codon:yes stop_codon:yes gene_type:complete
MKARSSKLKLEDLKYVEPITKNQERVFKAYKDNYNLILSGAAGTGKTFVAIANALVDILDKETQYKQLIIVRSIVPTRDIGFLPGDEEEKKLVYEAPYMIICNDLFNSSDAWDRLKANGDVQFVTTSFLRGITIDNAIVIVDEMQNLTGRELNTTITRLGNNCKFIACGDYRQSDFTTRKDKEDILTFLDIVSNMKMFQSIEFGWEDIVRSDLVREYIMTKEMMKLGVDW